MTPIERQILRNQLAIMKYLDLDGIGSDEIDETYELLKNGRI